MVAETNPHHVVNLAFVPVGRAPHRRHRGQIGFLLAHLGFEAQVNPVGIAVKLVNHREAGRHVLGPVDRGHVRQHVESLVIP